ncbi:MAG: hypothetical protein WCO98_12905 [bacterium]
MTKPNELSLLLIKFKNRIKLLLAEKSVTQGLFFSGIFAISLLIIDLLTEHFITPLMLLAIAVFGIAISIIIVLIRRINEVEIARAIEKYIESDNSISTAATLNNTDNEFYHPIHTKALKDLQELHPGNLFKLSWRRNHIYIAMVWTVVFLLYLLPEIPWFLTPAQRTDRELVHITGINLQQKAEEIEKTPEAEKYTDLKKIAKKMQTLGKKMERRRITKKEAMKELNKIENKLNEVGQKITSEEFKKNSEAMKSAGKALKEMLDKKMTKLREHAGKVNEAIKKGADENKLPPEDKLAKEIEERMQKISEMLQNADMEGLSEQLQAAGDEMQQGEMSDAEKKEMAEALRKLENELKNMSSEEISKALKEAAKQLESDKKNGTKDAGQSLKNAGGKIKWRMANGNSSGKSIKQMMKGGGGEEKEGEGKSGQNGSKSGSQSGKSGDGNNNSSNNGSPGPNNGGKHGTLTGKNNGSQPGSTDGNKELKIDYSNASMSVTIPSKVKGRPGKSTNSKVPYYEYYGEYKQRADSAVDNEEIPAANKEMVKSYFETLNPAESKK